jgi:sugar lactone lactonase YvrE
MADGHTGCSSERQVSRRKLPGTRWAHRAACLMVLTAALLGSVLPQASAAGGLGFSFTPSKTEPYAVCGRPTPRHAACLAIIVPRATALSSPAVLQPASPAVASPSFSGGGVGGGYDPAELQSAYDLPSASAGSGQTVAIVDAYNDPDAEPDLSRYRSYYGLSACTAANGCFKKVNQSGETTNYPTANAGWSVEISLDLDMASAACPNCHILLVEAKNNEDENLYTAEDEAVTLGASEVSNSWGGEEYSGETSSDSNFHHAGVPITASAGDDGYEVEYPAASQYVIAVGGTALTKASNSRGWTETAWSGTGSGCSKYEPKPSWQTDSPLCEKRTNNDVAAVASTETPVSVADSYELPKEFSIGEPGWTLVGGTSVSSPLIAGTMALANAYTKSFGGADALYKEASQNGTGVLDNVTSGNNVKPKTKSCGDYLCIAGPGYNGPTGLGSPYGAPVVLPNAPAVVTKAASSLTQTTASLNATVNPEGAEVSKCEFEYGETTSYGKTASCTSPPGSGTSAVAVSASLSGLIANTTYHFRISATNAGGESKGSDETLTTLPSCTPEGFCTSFTHLENREVPFGEPNAVAVDPSGNIWVADSGHDQVVEFNSKREYVRQLGSEGSGPGQFKGIGGIATDASGDLYVTDTGNDRVEEFSPSGTLLQTFGSSAPGKGQLFSPGAVAIDSSGDVWVLKAPYYGGPESGRVVEFSSSGEYLSQFGSKGTGHGQLELATGLAFSGGNLYVAELSPQRVQEFSTSGEFIRQFDENGPGSGQTGDDPLGIASDPTTGNLYVTELGNRVQEFSPTGSFITAFGNGQFSGPEGVAVSSSGVVYVADTGNDRVQEWKAGEPPTFATSFTHLENREVPFGEPNAVAVDPSGNIWVADSAHDHVIEFNSGREFLRELGSEGSGQGQFKGIGGLASNAEGDIYVSDPGNDRVQEFSSSGTFIRSFGSSATGNGQLLSPGAVAIDQSGDVWVLNGTAAQEGGRIVEFSASGGFLSQFGSNGSGHGQLGYATGLAFSGGNLYVAEVAPQRVQELSSSGVFIAQFDESGPGEPADDPFGIASDPTTGNLYVTELGDRVHKFGPSGSLLATFGSAGQGNGQLSRPEGVAVNSSGVIYVADTGNERLQEWAPGS